MRTILSLLLSCAVCLGAGLGMSDVAYIQTATAGTEAEAEGVSKSQLSVYWKMDESSGNMVDAVASFTITNYNTTAFTTGRINNGPDFVNASDNYFQTDDAAAISVSGDFTISVWFTVDDSDTSKYIAFKGDSSSSLDRIEYGILVTSGDVLYFIVGDDAENQYVELASATPITYGAGQWHHVVAYHDDGVGVGLYLDGGSVETAAYTYGAYDDNNTLSIGSARPITTTRDHDGIIDEFGLWKRVLTPAEASALYNSGSGLSYDSFTD